MRRQTVTLRRQYAAFALERKGRVHGTVITIPFS
jgi:hypothetical protein